MNKNSSVLPTPYSDINQFIQILLGNVRAVLGGYFTGMYLFGSLATGDFDANRSDIDVLVVTNKELPKKLISDLETMHTNLYESGLEWAKKLEEAYMPLNAIRVFSPTGPKCPLVNRKEFLVARPESNWVINRYILYACGIVITGPPLKKMIDPIRPEQLREAVLTLLYNNWTPWLANSDLFRGEGYQPFVVLNMCRALYILKNETVASKPHSARWVIENSDSKWTKLIKQAMEWHYGDSPGDIPQTQEFMRYVFKQAGL